jgi:hypothetical protein
MLQYSLSYPNPTTYSPNDEHKLKKMNMANSTYTQSSSINAEFSQYLKANGYMPGSQSEFSDTIYYFKKDHGVMISGDSVDFGVFNHEENGQRKPGCSLYAAFTGISKLDLRGWKMLLHITGTIPLNQAS